MRIGGGAGEREMMSELKEAMQALPFQDRPLPAGHEHTQHVC